MIARVAELAAFIWRRKTDNNYKLKMDKILKLKVSVALLALAGVAHGQLAITDLTELSAVPASGDFVPIVDVSDTTQAASGSTKKIQWSNISLWQASGTDIYYDAGNVGIGTSGTPAKKLVLSETSTVGSGDVDTGPVLRINNLSDSSLWGDGGQEQLGAIEFYSNDASTNGTKVRAAIRWMQDRDGIIPNGELSFLVGDLGDDVVEALRIDSVGNIGIGHTSPDSPLHIFEGVSGDPDATIHIRSNPRTADLFLSANDGSNSNVAAIYSGSGDDLRLGSGLSADDLIISSSGDVGIGDTTPDAKLDVATPASGAAIAVGRAASTASIVAGADASGGSLVLDGDSGGIVALNTFNSGDVAFVQGGGDVGVGTNTPSAKLHVLDELEANEVVARFEDSDGGRIEIKDVIGFGTDSLLAVHAIQDFDTAGSGIGLVLSADVDGAGEGDNSASDSGIVFNVYEDGTTSDALDVANPFSWRNGGVVEMFLAADGTLQLNDTTYSGTPSGGARIYSEGGEMKVTDTGGTETTISPHPVAVMNAMGIEGAARTLGMDYSVPQSGLAVAQPKARWLEWYVEIDHSNGQWTKRNFSGEEIDAGQSNELIK